MSTEIESDVARTAYQTGLRLLCADCGSEVVIVTPCPVHHPRQSFRCCGKDMAPVTPTEP